MTDKRIRDLPTVTSLSAGDVFIIDGTSTRQITQEHVFGNVAITGGTITGIGDPAFPQDVATKHYADAVAAGLNLKAPVRLATAAVLPNTPTYANGAAGVGATLTAGSNTTLTVDGIVAALNDSVLVKTQGSAFQNGVYTVTTAGSGAAAWVLTRRTDFDTAAEMLKGSYFLVTAGSTLTGSSYVLQATVATVGTDAATFIQFSSLAGGDMLKSDNLSGLANIVTSQTNLGVRKHLTGGLTLYVDNALGNDANAGTASGASAKKTGQSAWDDAVSKYDFRGFALDINFADATYGAGIISTQAPVGCTTIRINGNTTTPASCFIDQAADGCFRFQNIYSVPIQIKGFKLRSAAGVGIQTDFGTTVYLTDKMEFSTTTGAQIQASTASNIIAFANYTINGSSGQDHHHIINGATLGVDGITITLSGTPNFGGAFLGAAGCSTATYTSTVFSGSGTGTRYNIHGQSFVKTAAAAPTTFFPGNAAGTSDGGNLDDDTMGGPWVAFSPTPTPGSGAMTASSSGAYKRVGGSASKMITFRLAITITAAGTGAGTITCALPVGTSSGVSVALASDLNVTGLLGRALINNGSTTMSLLLFDGSTTMIHTGSVIGVSGTYEST